MPATDTDDATAIKKLLAAESAAYWNKDFEAWASCWVHAPYVRRLGWWSRGGVTGRRGWDHFGGRMRQNFIENPTPNKSAAEFRMENINLRIGKDMAWVTYDQYGPDTGEPATDMPGLSRETKILEKYGGEWKLVYGGYLHRAIHQVTSPLIHVDGEAMVTWKNTAADTILREGCGLAIRGGRLRAKDRGADQRLQAAIRWAARLDDGLEGRRGLVPITLETRHGLPPNLCWVVADSG